jgi:hypothetical protein
VTTMYLSEERDCHQSRDDGVEVTKQRSNSSVHQQLCQLRQGYEEFSRDLSGKSTNRVNCQKHGDHQVDDVSVQIAMPESRARVEAPPR